MFSFRAHIACVTAIALLAAGAGAQEPADSPTGIVTGRVTGEDGSPVSGAEVALNGEVRAITDETGRFRVEDAPVGSNEVLVRHLSYADASVDVRVTDPNRTVVVDVVLDPSPVEVAGVVAEAARRRPDLVIPGFEDRRLSGNGYFLDRLEIEARDPGDLEDVLRTVPGLRARPHPRGVEYRFTRRTWSLSRPDSITRRPEDRCRSPLVYVDGVQTGSGRREFLEIESLAGIDEVVGIEVYNGAARVPVEFNAMGSGCGVIAIWTERSLAPRISLDPSSPAGTGSEVGRSDSAFDLRRGVLIGAVVTGVAILFREAVCGMPHFCR